MEKLQSLKEVLESLENGIPQTVIEIESKEHDLKSQI